MIGTDKPPWRNQTNYDMIKLRIRCNNCKSIDMLTGWIPSSIRVTDYEIKDPCNVCGETDWDIDK